MTSSYYFFLFQPNSRGSAWGIEDFSDLYIFLFFEATKKRRRTGMYEEPVPRKKVKQDLNPYASTGGLMEASRKKRESRRQKERESRKTQIVEPEPEPVPQPRQQKQKQEEVQDDICRVCGSVHYYFQMFIILFIETKMNCFIELPAWECISGPTLLYCS